MTTVHDMVAEVRRIAAANPTHIYRSDPRGHGFCTYHAFDDSGELIPGKGCLVGHAFEALNITIDESENGDLLERINLDWYVDASEWQDTPEWRWLIDVQTAQDNGLTWADAVRLADQLGAVARLDDLRHTLSYLDEEDPAVTDVRAQIDECLDLLDQDAVQAPVETIVAR